MIRDTAEFCAPTLFLFFFKSERKGGGVQDVFGVCG